MNFQLSHALGTIRRWYPRPSLTEHTPYHETRSFAGPPASSWSFCIFFALTTVADAGGKGKKAAPPKIAYTAIISVDTAAKTITVGPKNSTATGTKTYKFTDKTTVTVNGKAGTLADLTPGQQIHVGIGRG